MLVLVAAGKAPEPRRYPRGRATKQPTHVSRLKPGLVVRPVAGQGQRLCKHNLPRWKQGVKNQVLTNPCHFCQEQQQGRARKDGSFLAASTCWVTTGLSS